MSKEAGWSHHVQHEKSSKDEEEVEKEESAAFQMTLIAAKIFSVSVASAITYAILVHSQDSVLDMELTYRWLCILVLWLTSFSTLSSFASFIVTVNNPSAFNCTHAEGEEGVVLRDKETQATPSTSAWVKCSCWSPSRSSSTSATSSRSTSTTSTSTAASIILNAS